MGSIDKFVFRTTLASLALIAVSLAGGLRTARATDGIDSMSSRGWMILTLPAMAIRESNAHRPQLVGRFSARFLARCAA